MLESYTGALIKSINKWGGDLKCRPIDTIYLGGGTPSLLAEHLPKVLNAVRSAFSVCEDAEITLELNPSGDCEKQLHFAKVAGINRLSIGAQSGNDYELKTLGRTHTTKETQKTVELARKMGFDNISLDIMIGLPDSTGDSLKKSLQFIEEMKPEHISAYILKIEERTAFFAEQNKLNLPDDDSTASQYLEMCDFFEKKGYNHYEISNFSKENKESRHNLKYWQLREYLGIGPSAHSFLEGKRFYYPRDLKGFITGNSHLPDGDGGTADEYIMLNLRLQSGISFKEYKERFGKEIPQDFLSECNKLQKANLLKITDKNIYLTDEGMLLSNSIISELMECLE